MSVTVKPDLRLASYNVRAALGTDLKRKPERVLAQLARMAPDILSLQEADHRMGNRPPAIAPHLFEVHTGLRPLPVSANGISLGWHGIALLARPGIEAEDVHRLNLPSLEPRGAVIADLKTENGQLRVVAVHLGLMRRTRKAQLSYIRNELGKLDSRPTVMLGDFNEWSRRKGMEPLGPDFTVTAPGATFPSRAPVVPLDRIAHSRRVSADVQVWRGQKHPHASDHLPILAEIKLDAETLMPSA